MNGYYIVKKGDTLFKIAKMFSGSGKRWKRLYLLNIRTIGINPNAIYTGQELTIPKSWKKYRG